MKNSLLIGVFLTSLLFSCQKTTSRNSSSQNNSVEKESSNTDYKPAFEGQTRIKAVTTKTPFQYNVIGEGLGKPWGIINLPDGRFLITEKTGFMNVVSLDGKTISPISGFPKVDSRGQGGMLDVILDPKFSENRLIYFSFSEPFGKGNLTSVAKAKLSSDEKSVSEVKVIFRAEPSYDGRLHYGSRLAFDKDGSLFVSTGERSDKETRALAQKTDNYLGKILKINTEGKAVEGNPFTGKEGFKPEIYAYGLRNPQGMVFDDKGQSWEAEMGPKGGDEINLIEAGKNYGWGDVTYGIEYIGTKVGKGISQKTGTEQPVYYWDPSVSPSGIDFYKGNIDEWKGNLIIGCLGGEHIIRIVLENNKVVGEERLLESVKERFRDVLSASDGNLYAITDSGKLYKISKK
jgi:glucose/arabinose dehydrogenase